VKTIRPPSGGKILIAEDSYLLAEVIADHLRDLGMEPVGPVGRLSEACYLARERALDGAVLDIKLGNFLCFPAASILLARGIPFVFLSGYSDKTIIPLQCRAAPLIYKPFEADELKEAIKLSEAGPGPRRVSHDQSSDQVCGEPLRKH
jgi:DNA-binding response OmpR family regulator